MTSVIRDAIMFNSNVMIKPLMGVVDKGHANSLAPRFLEDEFSACQFLLSLAKQLSKTLLYAKEINLSSYSRTIEGTNKFLSDMDISYMRPITLKGIFFSQLKRFNTGCLKNLEIRDDDDEDESEITVQNLDYLKLCLFGEKTKNICLKGYFGTIEIYIEQNHYLNNLNEIFKDVKGCRDLRIISIIRSYNINHQIDLSFVHNSVHLYGCIDERKFTYNERLKILHIQNIAFGEQRFLAPSINYDHTILFLKTFPSSKQYNLEISKSYPNTNVRIYLEKGVEFLVISNVDDKIFNIAYKDNQRPDLILRGKITSIEYKRYR